MKRSFYFMRTHVMNVYRTVVHGPVRNQSKVLGKASYVEVYDTILGIAIKEGNLYSLLTEIRPTYGRFLIQQT